MVAALWLVLALAGRAPALQRRLPLICLSLATGTWLMLLGYDAAARRPTDWVALPLLLLAWPVVHRPFSLTPLHRLAPLGQISFAVYLVSSTLLFWLARQAPSFSSTAATFTARFLILRALTTLAAWWLERRLIPALTSRFAPSSCPASRSS